MTTKHRIRPGDRVAVPWGLGEIEGQVVEIYGPPGHQHVLVDVPVHGPSGEILESSEISFPEDSVRHVP